LEILRQFPQVANRDCDVCLRKAFDEKTGLIELSLDGKTELDREARFPAPCRAHAMGLPGYSPCPKGTPEKPKTLTEQNKTALEFYRRCKATNSFPDDEIVREYAAIIEAHDKEVSLDRLKLIAMSCVVEVLAARVKT
jgi:hypothetical protein